MTYTSYREIGGPDGALASLVPFEGNTMRGYRDAKGIYCVKSYATLIAWYDDERRMVVVRDTKYSITTTRHQNLCRVWLAYLDRKGLAS